MSLKTVTNECSECGTKYSVISDSPESLAFCPFCGDSVLMRYDAADIFDEDLNDVLDDDDELDDESVDDPDDV